MGSRVAGVAMAFAVIALASSSAASCSSGSYGEAEGAESGPCYPNGTCNVGLLCASGRCVRFDQVSDAGTNGDADGDGGVDAPFASDAAGDGDADLGPCSPPSSPPAIACEDQTGSLISCNPNAARFCCVDDRACADTCATNKQIECLSPFQCGATERCCALATTNALSCATMDSFQKTTCRSGGCTGSEVSLCWGGGAQACDTGKSCAGARLVIDYGPAGGAKTIDVGFCK